MTRAAGLVLALAGALAAGALAAQSPAWITHGPILGRPGATHMGVWARTSRPAQFRVRYGLSPQRLDLTSEPVTTRLENDNTGWVLLHGLQPNTRYYYALSLGKDPTPVSLPGSFRTLPDAASFHNPQSNPAGLFNFAFQFACGNNQTPRGGGPHMPAYRTMLDRLAGRIDFAILNGDFIYEEMREYPVESWMAAQGIGAAALPRVLSLVPSLAGVWQNYKLYLERARNLADWHREIPALFTIDDHEILGDVFGAGEVGYRNKAAVFRDVGFKAWFDYVGWSNPVTFPAEVRFGEASLERGRDILADPAADFSRLDLKSAPTLHVHWGTPGAGLKEKEEEGDPNAGVYRIVEVLDANRLRIEPPARATGRSRYSTSRAAYSGFRVGNANFFLLDCRGNRSLHDRLNPRKPGVSMLGPHQKAWLMESMRASDAQFFFVVSSVNFMVPHVRANDPKKDDAWTSFLEEREELIRFWDSLGKPVVVLTGDLHMSYTVRITDRVWEVASGPVNSPHHTVADAGNIPPNGPYNSQGRRCEIRWSSFLAPDTQPEARRKSLYTVVDVRNVLNSPVVPGKDRWMAWPCPHILVEHRDGATGALLYAETIR